MHELSISLSLLDLAEEEAERRGGARVVAVHLKFGTLSGVVPAALRSAYDLAREGHALADADLVIEEIPVVIYCPACAAEREIAACSSKTWAITSAQHPSTSGKDCDWSSSL